MNACHAFLPLLLSLLSLSVHSFMAPSLFAVRPPYQREQAALTKQYLILDEKATSSLTTYFLETVISAAVPSVAVIATLLIGSAFISRMGNKDDTDDDDDDDEDLYSDIYYEGQKSSSSSLKSLFKQLFDGKKSKRSSKVIKNLGIPPREYITIKNLNKRYESYDYTMTTASKSQADAIQQGQQFQFQRAINKLDLYNSNADANTIANRKEILLAQDKFQKESYKHTTTINKLLFDISKASIDTNSTTIPQEMFNKLSKAQQKLIQAEITFWNTLMKNTKDETQKGAIQVAWLGNVAGRGTLENVPTIISNSNPNSATKPRNLFVTRFNGDITASQVESLREEVTAIVRTAKPGVDQALLVLESGGGTVTGYGLAAGQLKRFKDHGIHLTVCVEQVAASGGYMMCCVADKIIASPFCVLGSIGVISDIPNVYERLKKEGIEFQTVTAGKYKRTLTPTKQVTEEDLEKSKEEIEEILVLFKEFVHQNRPSLDIDAVATGETWFGEAALNKGLCDEIRAVDDVLLDHIKQGYQVLDVSYDPPEQEPLLKELLGVSTKTNIFGKGLRWLVQTVSREIKAELRANGDYGGGIQQKYLMKDDSIKDKYRM